MNIFVCCLGLSSSFVSKLSTIGVFVDEYGWPFYQEKAGVGGPAVAATRHRRRVAGRWRRILRWRSTGQAATNAPRGGIRLHFSINGKQQTQQRIRRRSFSRATSDWSVARTENPCRVGLFLW